MPERVAPGATTVVTLVGELASLLEPGVVRGHFDDAQREAREIVAAIEDKPRFWAALNPDIPVGDALRQRATAAASRRVRGAPLAYAVGRASFRHLVLDVDERVLIPRPETEQLVELTLALSKANEPGGVAIDVGTGSGAIALSLAAEGRFDRLIATDLSTDALQVAARNYERLRAGLHATVELRHGSLLEPVADVRARCIVSNPPYIAFDEAFALPASVRDWEPPLALYSAEQGLALTALLVREAADRLEPGGVIALEVDARRAALVADLIGRDARYEEVAVTLDLFGNERFVTARRRK